MLFSLNKPGLVAALLLGGCSATPASTPPSSADAVVMVGSAAAGACPIMADARPYAFGLDPTELASFESQAKTNVVFVAAEGCSLRVLPTCDAAASPGKLGGYRPLLRTSVNRSRMDIRTTGELYAKLPVGGPGLLTRLEAGESLHADYFVVGMREAEYGQQYRDDLSTVPGCAGATHFVYAYAAGAFALHASGHRDALRRGGDLEACDAQGADASRCESPVRLYLRPIVDGHRPPQATLDVAAK